MHSTAVVDEKVAIGPGTKIWHFSHVLGGSKIGENCNIGQNVVIGPDVTIGGQCKIQNNVSVYKGVTPRLASKSDSRKRNLDSAKILKDSEKEKMGFEKLKKRRAVERESRKIRSERLESSLLERGLTVFKKFGIRRVIVFGSVADGVCDDMSDLDILVMPLKNSRYWDFRYELEEAVDLPIDLYTDLDDPIIVEKITSRGETLYEV